MTYGTTHYRWEARIAEILTRSGYAVEQLSPRTWRVSLWPERTVPVTIRLCGGDWLTVDLPVERAVFGTMSTSEQEWELLRANSELPGGVKFALQPHDGSLHLQAEIPLAEESDLAYRIDDVWVAFHTAWKQIVSNASSRRHDASQAVQPTLDVSCDLLQLCREAGWVCTQRDTGTLAVALDVPSHPHPALVTQPSTGGLHATVDLATWQAITQPCRQALSTLLLAVGGVVRMVRPLVAESEMQICPRLEVRWSNLPTAMELGHALSALSVALRCCGREVQVIGTDERIATTYLQHLRAQHETHETIFTTNITQSA